MFSIVFFSPPKIGDKGQIHFSLLLYFRDSLNINTKKTTHEIKKSTAKTADIVLVNNNSIN
jgi:hypothetical protein